MTLRESCGTFLYVCISLYYSNFLSKLSKGSQSRQNTWIGFCCRGPRVVGIRGVREQLSRSVIALMPRSSVVIKLYPIITCFGNESPEDILIPFPTPTPLPQMYRHQQGRTDCHPSKYQTHERTSPLAALMQRRFNAGTIC